VTDIALVDVEVQEIEPQEVVGLEDDVQTPDCLTRTRLALLAASSVEIVEAMGWYVGSEVLRSWSHCSSSEIEFIWPSTTLQ
jgi:hypothetical protein